ncbi:hypothetical protein BpHYR1_017467, partial [Brachionus plicatilis]
MVFLLLEKEEFVRNVKLLIGLEVGALLVLGRRGGHLACGLKGGIGLGDGRRIVLVDVAQQARLFQTLCLHFLQSQRVVQSVELVVVGKGLDVAAVGRVALFGRLALLFLAVGHFFGRLHLVHVWSGGVGSVGGKEAVERRAKVAKVAGGGGGRVGSVAAFGRRVRAFHEVKVEKVEAVVVGRREQLGAGQPRQLVVLGAERGGARGRRRRKVAAVRQYGHGGRVGPA